MIFMGNDHLLFIRRNGDYIIKYDAPYRKINTEVIDQSCLISHDRDLFNMILPTSMLDHEIRTCLIQFQWFWGTFMPNPNDFRQSPIGVITASRCTLVLYICTQQVRLFWPLASHASGISFMFTGIILGSYAVAPRL
jgi:hypothetical protein